MPERFIPAALMALVALAPGFNATTAAATEAETADLLLLEEVFIGRTTARGVFQSKLAGVKRPFDVVANGTWDGKTLTLVEDFAFDDGEKDRKTWRFTKIAPDRYEGTREDVVGTAKVRVYPDRITLKYLIDLPRDNGTFRVRFSDIITAEPDGRIRNVARVSKFGLKIGEVDLYFER